MSEQLSAKIKYFTFLKKQIYMKATHVGWKHQYFYLFHDDYFTVVMTTTKLFIMKRFTSLSDCHGDKAIPFSIIDQYGVSYDENRDKRKSWNHWAINILINKTLVAFSFDLNKWTLKTKLEWLHLTTKRYEFSRNQC